MDLVTPIDYQNEVSFDSTTPDVLNDISQLPPSTNFKDDTSYANILVEETRRRGRPLKLDKPLRTRMGFRISDEMLQEVEALCEQTGLSKTDLILQAIQSYIDSNRSLTGIEQHS
ncbi:MAG TPA: hypothetical protein DGB85_05725 [Deltaproteobacteria bacterium]|nr:hypothetical protein [Deltaproteobacteria bacterium]